ncbi:Lsr2 family protein [Streptomyces sp. NBC_00568]|uniref:histone-like nucleoid-structuring protein Lsr2 n=1 Tax=Streptomyces sp. NBC_00568 TaxID=2975779 RepID=UPI002250E443|nr:Lsr2 family protein [Streptomyces sp. NBC_00568]MCX4993532.1 Lsr2 family protein [Streptomyces sp. NBC_00568]
MVQKVITTLVDDVTGEQSQDIATHSILVDGAGVEIDLTDENYEKLLEILNPYLHAEGARRVRAGTKPKAKTQTTTASRDESSAMRAWARENGYAISDRGRVPAAVREAYGKAK